MIQKLEYETERDRGGNVYGVISPSNEEIIAKVNEVVDYINSLPDENNPEPYNPIYNEDYLNEKIAKAAKSWEGVDVDAMLAECRGYEEKPSADLEEAAEESLERQDVAELLCGSYEAWQMLEMFKAGAAWQKKQGVLVHGEIELDFSDPDDIYARRLLIDYYKELGPALMKFNPKDKVIVQIRKEKE